MRAGFPHSEIFGSKLACQLPEAYRRLQRPSSPVVAKASTTCTYSLDPITVSTASLERGAPPQASLCAWWAHRRLSRVPGTNTANAISYPDESGRLNSRTRLVSSKFLKSSRMKQNALRKVRPSRCTLRKRSRSWWSQPGSNR